jgi:hypothetical protein
MGTARGSGHFAPNAQTNYKKRPVPSHELDGLDESLLIVKINRDQNDENVE